MQNNKIKKTSNKNIKIVLIGLIGSVIEFYDFYIYGIASATFLGPLFFPSDNKSLQLMISLLTFGIAFISKPIGSIILGHYGDKISRKSSLIFSIVFIGFGTAIIGLLPTYESIGIWAPVLLCLMRFLQGLGMGGAWSGGVILTTEYAPTNKRAIFGMFSQIAPPIAFIMASLIFIILGKLLNQNDMLNWGWRIPFILSIVLVIVGIYIRVSVEETPVYKKFEEKKEQLKLPIWNLIKTNIKEIIFGSLSFFPCYVLFFVVTVFTLSYMTTPQNGTDEAVFGKEESMLIIMISVIFMIISSPLAAICAEKFGRRKVLIIGGIMTFISGLFFGFIMQTNNIYIIFTYFCILFFLMGIINTPLAAFLPELFSVKVRYSGTSVISSLSGLLGGSLTPFIANRLNATYGIGSVGLFLSLSAFISVMAVYILKETKNNNYEN